MRVALAIAVIHAQLQHPSSTRVVSNRWTGLWTGLLDWIAGLNSEERCQTSMQDCMCSEDLCLARSYRRS